MIPLGTKVRYVTGVIDSYLLDQAGIIRSYEPPGNPAFYGVEWNPALRTVMSLHNCGGAVPSGYGWYVPVDTVIPFLDLNEDEEETEIGSV